MTPGGQPRPACARPPVDRIGQHPPLVAVGPPTCRRTGCFACQEADQRERFPLLGEYLAQAEERPRRRRLRARVRIIGSLVASEVRPPPHRAGARGHRGESALAGPAHAGERVARRARRPDAGSAMPARPWRARADSARPAPAEGRTGAARRIERRRPPARLELRAAYVETVARAHERAPRLALVVDVGSGRESAFARRREAGRRITVVGLDASDEELRFNEDVDERRTADLGRPAALRGPRGGRPGLELGARAPARTPSRWCARPRACWRPAATRSTCPRRASARPARWPTACAAARRRASSAWPCSWSRGGFLRLLRPAAPRVIARLHEECGLEVVEVEGRLPPGRVLRRRAAAPWRPRSGT